MTQAAVQAVIGRAVTDAGFREALFADPAQALAGYDLSAEEMAALEALDAEQVAAFAGTLDERISKSAFARMGLPDGGDTTQGQLVDI
jgi:hypothetical protein